MTSDARRDASRLVDLLRTEHGARADFLLALADFDRGRGWAALGHASLWAFLHHDLGLSSGAAFQRKEAVALLREFPAVEAPLRDGRLCLSSVAAVATVAKVLKPGHQVEWLPRFFGLSAREARALAAELVPAEVVPARVVVTPVAPKVVVGTAQGPSDGGETGGSFLTCETGKTQPGRGATSTPTSVENLPLPSGAGRAHLNPIEIDPLAGSIDKGACP